jgi:hypothetical protein
MEITDTHQTIASQIDNMRPSHLLPGRHIGMAPVDERTVLVLVGPTGVLAVVRYEPGPDLYSVVVNRSGGETREFDGVYCDQLGELIFGVDAGAWTLPMGAIITEGDDGQLQIKEF